jgi:transcription elongation factor GreA
MASEASYLTAEGEIKLRQELEFLKGPGREELAKRLRAAIQQGDLSENADYTAAKEDQAFMEGRIQELDRILANAIIIDDMKTSKDIISIGSRVTIEEPGFDPEEYHLVGPKEADPRKGRISHESPIGRALIGHRTGEIVMAETPNGVIEFKIVKIG